MLFITGSGGVTGGAVWGGLDPEGSFLGSGDAFS